MIRNRKRRLIIGFVLGFLILSFAALRLCKIMKEYDEIEEKIKNEYTVLLRQDSINSPVLSTYYPENWRGGEYIQNVKLQNGENYTIEIKRNITASNVFFGDILKKGAILYKNAGSDTLRVTVGDKEYEYLIFGDE
jgi:hypothetical protein